MRAILSFRLLIVAILFIGGCAGKPEIPFDRSQTPPVKTIGVLTPYIPDDAGVILASSVGQSFWLVGALVDAGMRASRESTFKQIMTNQGFAARDIITKDLVDHVGALGYAAIQVPVARDHADYLKQYPKATETAADAYLDVVVGAYGYMAAGIGDSTPYRPAVRIKVRLVRATDASVLMEDLVFYNPLGTPEKVITIAPDPDYDFADFDALVANPPKAKAGLENAIDQSADTVAKLLR
jgi:hypothetical protein